MSVLLNDSGGEVTLLPSGNTSAYANGVAIDSQDRVVFSGQSTLTGGGYNVLLGRLEADGDRWTPLNKGAVAGG